MLVFLYEWHQVDVVIDRDYQHPLFRILGLVRVVHDVTRRFRRAACQLLHEINVLMYCIFIQALLFRVTNDATSN